MPEAVNSLSHIQTKLNRSPLPVDLVPRPRLSAWLEQWRERPLTLVSAPTGYGKSTLISYWLKSVDSQSTWLSLDEGDIEFGGIPGHILAAIRIIFPSAMSDTKALLVVTPLPPISAMAKIMINELIKKKNLLSSYWTTITRSNHKPSTI